MPGFKSECRFSCKNCTENCTKARTHISLHEKLHVKFSVQIFVQFFARKIAREKIFCTELARKFLVQFSVQSFAREIARKIFRAKNRATKYVCLPLCNFSCYFCTKSGTLKKQFQNKTDPKQNSFKRKPARKGKMSKTNQIQSCFRAASMNKFKRKLN